MPLTLKYLGQEAKIKVKLTQTKQITMGAQTFYKT